MICGFIVACVGCICILYVPKVYLILTGHDVNEQLEIVRSGVSGSGHISAAQIFRNKLSSHSRGSREQRTSFAAGASSVSPHPRGHLGGTSPGGSGKARGRLFSSFGSSGNVSMFSRSRRGTMKNNEWRVEPIIPEAPALPAIPAVSDNLIPSSAVLEHKNRD